MNLLFMFGEIMIAHHLVHDNIPTVPVAGILLLLRQKDYRLR